MAELALRPVDPLADAAFLLRVYAGTRAEELSVVEWPAGQLDAFLRQQFDAQDAYWAQQRPATERSVIVVDGQDAGRLYVDRSGADEIRVVDIALLPEHREHGVGERLLCDLLDEGDRSDRPVTIHVERGNRARALYQRLGFVAISPAGAYDLYERPPGAARLPSTSRPESVMHG